MKSIEDFKETQAFKYCEKAMDVYGFARHDGAKHDAYWYYELFGFLLDRVDGDIANVSYPPCVRTLTSLRYVIVNVRNELFNMSVPAVHLDDIP